MKRSLIAAALAAGLMGSAAFAGSQTVSSWEGSLEGWNPDVVNFTGFSNATGVTDGLSSLEIGVKAGYQRALWVDAKPFMATARLADSVSVDVTAPEGAATGHNWFEFILVMNGEGIGYTQGTVTAVPLTNTPTSVTYNLGGLLDNLPADPSYFEILIITNNDPNGTYTSAFLDNVRFEGPRVPEPSLAGLSLAGLFFAGRRRR